MQDKELTRKRLARIALRIKEIESDIREFEKSNRKLSLVEHNKYIDLTFEKDELEMERINLMKQ